MVQTFFVPGLLTGKLQRRQKSAIQKTIRDLLVQRNIPLHVTNIWNALYYRWDFESGCHSLLNPIRIETRALGARDWAIPVGGFLRIETGSNEVWAEVVYKEGRNPGVSAGSGEVEWSVPSALVNSSSDRTIVFQGRQVDLLDELLVLDFDAFGMGQLDEKRIRRLQTQGKRLNKWGHLPMEAAYELGESELDDAGYFAAHLMSHHRDGLIAEFLTRQLDAQEMRELLLSSLRTVSDLAAEIDGVRQWNGYFFLDDDYRRAENDRARDTDFGSDMFRTVFGYVLRLPPQRKHDIGRPQVGHSATVPALRSYVTPNGIDQHEVEGLSGPNHSRLVCWINTYIADQVRATKEGIVTFGTERFAVRRADPWMLGGVWRSERVIGEAPIHTKVPALVPLPLDSPSLPSIDDVKRELAASPSLYEIPAKYKRKQRRITLFLSQRSIEQEQLHLSHAIAAISASCESVRLQIGIEGEQTIWLDEIVQVDRARAVLTDVPFGACFYPGLRLAGSVEKSGEVIRLFAKRLLVPKVIEGYRLEFELNEDLYLSNRAIGREQLRRASTFSELISRVFRGKTTQDGGLALSLQETSVALFGPDADLEMAQIVAGELKTLDRLPDGRYVWRPNITRSTKVTDAALIAAFQESEAGKRIGHTVKSHPVIMHLRRNPPRDDKKWQARAEQYQRDLLFAIGAQHRLPPQLPRDRTFVKSHERGNKAATIDVGKRETSSLPVTPQLALFADSPSELSETLEPIR